MLKHMRRPTAASPSSKISATTNDSRSLNNYCNVLVTRRTLSERVRLSRKLAEDTQPDTYAQRIIFAYVMTCHTQDVLNFHSGSFAWNGGRSGDGDGWQPCANRSVTELIGIAAAAAHASAKWRTAIRQHARVICIKHSIADIVIAHMSWDDNTLGFYLNNKHTNHNHR